MPRRSILVADDIENRTVAGKRRSQVIRGIASSLAKRLKTGIDLLYVEDVKTYPPGRFDTARIKAWHSQHQAKLEEAGSNYQVPVRCILKSGAPAEQILKTMRTKAAPELIVVGTQGRQGPKRLLIGSVAEEVVRHSKRPVTVIGPVAQERDQNLIGQKQLKILVATDLGRNSRAAEHYALSFAKRTGAGVVLFHCLGESFRKIIRDGSAISGYVPYNLDEILARIQEEAVEDIERKVRFFEKQGVPCYYKVDDKQTTSSCAIYQEGEQGYSIVAMGTHGRSVLLTAFLGSTARETILHASIPVIVVHSGR